MQAGFLLLAIARLGYLESYTDSDGLTLSETLQMEQSIYQRLARETFTDLTNITL